MSYLDGYDRRLADRRGDSKSKSVCFNVRYWFSLLVVVVVVVVVVALKNRSLRFARKRVPSHSLSGPAMLVLQELILFHLGPQLPAGDTKFFGGMGLVPIFSFQRLQDGNPFQLGKRHS